MISRGGNRDRVARGPMVVMTQATPLEVFTRTSRRAADEVIGSYSTSFGLATVLLGKRHRYHVRAIYALVRVADEIVDGVAAEAGLDPARQRRALEDFARQTHEAIESGYATDMIVHAFACTAREVGIGRDLIDPFFAAMAMDLPDAAPISVHDHDTYVYGSAEVVGLMCLRVFIHGTAVTEGDRERLVEGSRQLGAAFQDINFLRDLGDDAARGRHYLAKGDHLDDATKDAWVARVRGQLAAARSTVGLLPPDARAAIVTAHDLFAELTRRIDEASAQSLYRERIRVPAVRKAWIISRAVVHTRVARRS